MNSSDRLQLAKTAVKAGDREEATNILLALVDADPHNELAWLWLSDLVPTPEDRIIALENALAINPQRVATQRRLAGIRQEQAALPVDTLAKAQDFAVNGRRQEAYSLLIDKLQRAPDDPEAWFAFSRMVDDIDDQIAALHYVVELRPWHTEALRRLTQLQLAREDNLALGRSYESFGDLAKAIAAYRLAAKKTGSQTDQTIARKRLDAARRHYKLYRHIKKPLRFPDISANHALVQGRGYEESGDLSRATVAYQAATELAVSSRERRIAQQRLNAAERQQRKAVRMTQPLTTLVRLSVGPFLLYLFLILLHAGLLPGQVSPGLALASLGVLLGSIILITVKMMPHQALGQRLLGELDHKDWMTRALLGLLGFLLLLLPFLLLLLNALDRLAIYSPSLP